MGWGEERKKIEETLSLHGSREWKEIFGLPDFWILLIMYE
jgi:hypothetical protein